MNCGQKRGKNRHRVACSALLQKPTLPSLPAAPHSCHLACAILRRTMADTGRCAGAVLAFFCHAVAATSPIGPSASCAMSRREAADVILSHSACFLSMEAPEFRNSPGEILCVVPKQRRNASILTRILSSRSSGTVDTLRDQQGLSPETLN